MAASEVITTNSVPNCSPRTPSARAWARSDSGSSVKVTEVVSASPSRTEVSRPAVTSSTSQIATVLQGRRALARASVSVPTVMIFLPLPDVLCKRTM